MHNFNSFTEVTNTLANFTQGSFILVPSFNGKYIPKSWAYISQNAPNPIQGNPFLTLPTDIILGIQGFLSNERMDSLIYFSITPGDTDIQKAFHYLINFLMEIPETWVSVDDAEYYDYIPDTFNTLYHIIYGLSFLHPSPQEAYTVLLKDTHITQLLASYKERFYNDDPQDTENLYNTIKDLAFTDFNQDLVHINK